MTLQPKIESYGLDVGLNENIDLLFTVNSVHWYQHVSSMVTHSS